MGIEIAKISIKKNLQGLKGGEVVEYSDRTIICNWNRTWTPFETIDECVWTACIDPPQVIKNKILTGTYC